MCFLDYGIPVVCHFGSTTWGIINATPQTNKIENSCRDVIYQLKNDGAIKEISIKSRRPMRDIAEVELYTSLLSNKVIATSKIVRDELIEHGVPHEKVVIIYNAIEDFWFGKKIKTINPPKLVFLGRVGGDVFNIKLKGIDRLIAIYRLFPKLDKLSIFSTDKNDVNDWMDKNISKHTSLINIDKLDILKEFKALSGSFIIITSRYEGFSLSLVEAMSQGLIPITYSVGIAPEIIKNGENGYIVKSIKSAEKIIKELLNKPDELHRLSMAASKTARLFSADKMAKELISLYKEVINDSGYKAITTKSTEEINNIMSIIKNDESEPFSK